MTTYSYHYYECKDCGEGLLVYGISSMLVHNEEDERRYKDELEQLNIASNMLCCSVAPECITTFSEDRWSGLQSLADEYGDQLPAIVRDFSEKEPSDISDDDVMRYVMVSTVLGFDGCRLSSNEIDDLLRDVDIV